MIKFQAEQSLKVKESKIEQKSIENYSHAFRDSGKMFPIFAMFEVIQVFRKTEKDHQE